MKEHKKTPSNKDLKGNTSKPSLTIEGISLFLYYLIMPSLLIFLSVRFFSFTNLTWLAVIYIVTLVSIVLFFVFKFHHRKMNNLAFVLGLILSPLYAYISDARWVALSRALLGENLLDFSYTNTTFAILFYTFPLTFLAVIVLIIMLVIRARKNIVESSK